MAFLSGANNDAMVNRLVSQGFIRSAEVEQAFRVVDRGEFVPDDRRAQAYNDAPVKNEKHIHVSAPHFYALVLEVLKLGPDMRFLNVCSGSGYLTMLAAYLIGPGGLLHSIEPTDAAYKFSEQRANKFISESPFQNRFCHSSYSKSSIFQVENRRKYDRIYIGGACPRDKLNFLISFLKIGGIMVVPIHEELLKITRISGKSFTRQVIAQVTFLALQVPKDSGTKSGWTCLSDKVRQDGEKVPLSLPENRDPMAKRLLSRFRALLTALECIPSGSDLPQPFCFIPRTVGSVLVKEQYPEIKEAFAMKCYDLSAMEDEEEQIDVGAVVSNTEHRKDVETRYFWEDLRDDTLWQEMVDFCFAAGIEDEESRMQCFKRICKAAVVKKVSQNDHHHVFHDALCRSRRSPFPMMMESYEDIMMDLFDDSDSDSDETGERSRSERRGRMGMMGRGHPMMPEMLMMEMMHGFDFEDPEFLFEEMPFMMRMGPMRRMGRGSAQKREFDEERSHETTEAGVIDADIRTIPTTSLGRDWPPYNDCTGGDSLSRRAQASSLPTDFFPFDSIPPFPGDPSFGRSEASHFAMREARSRAVNEARSVVETLRSSNPSEAHPPAPPAEAAAAASKTSSPPHDIDVASKPVPMETETDRKRKEKEKRRETKLKRAREAMANMRRKSGMFKPGDNYHAVPDWEMVCLLGSRPSKDWTYEHDDELVRYLYKEVEKGSVMMMNTPLEKTLTPDLFSDKEKLELYPKLSSYSPVVLTFRSVMLKRIVHLMDSVLHLVAGTSTTTSIIQGEEADVAHSCFSEESFIPSHGPSDGLGKAQLVQPKCSVMDQSSTLDATGVFKSLLAFPQFRLLLPLSQKRQALINALLRCSEDRKHISKARLPSINLDRRIAIEATDLMNNLDVSIFMQVYSELKHGKMIKYRWPRLSREQWWEVKFIGEGIIDQGGGFRDSMAHMADELCPSDPTACNHLPFFVKTPNQREEVGDYQDCYIPNPSCYSPDIYRWIGQLMGAAYRSSETFCLVFPPFVWKMLLGVQVTWAQDYVTVDHDFVRNIDLMENMPEEVYVNDLQSTTTHAVTLSDGSVVELKENGSQQSVLAGERHRFADLVRKVRMTECEEQVSWIREGLLSVVPEGLLSLITWQELEVNICGDAEIAINDLKSQCHYSDEMAAGSEQVRQLWKALESFSLADRSRFVRFVTGRKRLPAMFTVSRSARLLAEDALPTASTCANTLYLPRFSSDEMAARRLRYAIYNCVAIDTDTNPW